MMTVQAKRVKDALQAIGLQYGSFRTDGEFTVKTDIKRRRSPQSGMRYSEYGTARALVDRRAHRLVEANAQRLADQELTVMLVYGGMGDLITTVVTSKHNPRHEVSRLTDGVWDTMMREQGEVALGLGEIDGGGH